MLSGLNLLSLKCLKFLPRDGFHFISSSSLSIFSCVSCDVTNYVVTYIILGLGWPNCSKHHIRNMWLCSCALWDHFVTHNEGLWEKSFFQRCAAFCYIKFILADHEIHSINHFLRTLGGYSSLTPGLSPINPTLSTRLCSGNGELLKHDQDVPSEDFCRQEMY